MSFVLDKGWFGAQDSPGLLRGYLLMFSAAGFDMRVQPIPALLDWLKGYYRPSEGVFRTQEKPISNFVQHISAVMKEFEQKYGTDYWITIAKTSAPVLRYHLYHLVEDDWLTYYSTRIALNMTPRGEEETAVIDRLQASPQGVCDPAASTYWGNTGARWWGPVCHQPITKQRLTDDAASGTISPRR